MFRIDDESGAVVARLSVGEAEFWVADESPEHLNFSPESLGGGTVRMVMVVEDPDAAFERAVTAGATVVWPVSNQYAVVRRSLIPRCVVRLAKNAPSRSRL